MGKLARAGVDFAAFASNTPHLVFNEARARSPVPLISIVVESRTEAERRGLKKVGLFGTRFTMQATFYQDVFSRLGIDVIASNQNEQDYIHEHYMNELVNGIYLPETRSRLFEIVEQLKERS
ncbi:MAG TPA: aspartate/glutamate racemase family protein [Pyrinomonadaceae bacterium]|nr:aspartate/glutamate racemase family protein [Pyrinomonadaceae bacterium]